MSKAWCSALPGGVRLAVQITANAKKTEVIGVLDDALKLKLHAQPIEGKANEALIRYLAATLAVPGSAITLTHGQTNKRKLLEIVSAKLTPEVVARLMGVAAT
ncbi:MULTISPECIES: DUF167 domain-containing protein [unclassified Janthinobacterium]|uniref:DUF167 domain-containing protein n=1 Tax=unclassified Janthinobacterium TaxID=2610881 RepID=UPI0003747394|nr:MULTISPECIES: DUF167 domain-containing protein [unclassified Janthinobacterium]MEC5159608.1 uncharacterized protein (TIGR00251 family) [Janthinobacterium sp. CG_S6]